MPINTSQLTIDIIMRIHCPAAEEAARTSLALPIYPELTPEQKQYVVNCIRTFYEM